MHLVPDDDMFCSDDEESNASKTVDDSDTGDQTEIVLLTPFVEVTGGKDKNEVVMIHESMSAWGKNIPDEDASSLNSSEI